MLTFQASIPVEVCLLASLWSGADTLRVSLISVYVVCPEHSARETERPLWPLLTEWPLTLPLHTCIHTTRPPHKKICYAVQDTWVWIIGSSVFFFFFLHSFSFLVYYVVISLSVCLTIFSFCPSPPTSILLLFLPYHSGFQLRLSPKMEDSHIVCSGRGTTYNVMNDWESIGCNK